MNRAIGGYFELADRVQATSLPIEGVLLNTARNALEYILMLTRDVNKIYLPYYTCEAVLEPLVKLAIPYQFYSINNSFEIAESITLRKGEYLIANNYFGIKDAYIKLLTAKYGHHLIIDNAQAFFSPVIPGIKACYSARKYVGVSDGGIAVGVSTQESHNFEYDNSDSHNDHLFIRKEKGAEAGFQNYQQNECKLDGQPIRQMSLTTRDILQHIDYSNVMAQRRINYQYLHESLKAVNQLHLPDIDTFVCPMVYPFMHSQGIDLRQKLINNKVFIARYWPNVLQWISEDCFERQLTLNLLPLPVDQRYGVKDMNRIIHLLKD